MKKIYVQFRERNDPEYKGMPYAFFTEIEVKPGDFVVVNTKYGLALGRVSETVPFANDTANQEVICKVDTTEFERKQEIKKKLLDLEVQMEEAYEKAEKLSLFKILAKDNPEFKKMLDEFEQLKNSL